ncbi:MAG: hypothetical protein D6786_08505 [Gammaproteobacteria bacterium]|nr:MAG: hypothetical protein D6786_08505 [Gammaproteobacteria bacterium]
MRITLVKKIKADGSLCRKCAEVTERLEREGHMGRIDQVLIADERDPQSPGMLLAREYRVERAPFFLVEDDGGETRVYTVYLQFLKEVLQQQTSEAEEATEILRDNPDLDFL